MESWPQDETPTASTHDDVIKQGGAMTSRILVTLSLLVALTALTGCYVQYNTSRVLPDATINPYKTYYVVHHADDPRQIDQVISREMRAMGLPHVSNGPENGIPEGTDVIVVYEDRWMWDMTNYLLMLKIQFRDASNNLLLARGQSYRTSLVRKSVEEMVQETLVGIFSYDEKGA